MERRKERKEKREKGVVLFIKKDNNGGILVV